MKDMDLLPQMVLRWLQNPCEEMCSVDRKKECCQRGGTLPHRDCKVGVIFIASILFTISPIITPFQVIYYGLRRD